MRRQWLLMFASLLLLWTIVTQVNHYLAVWHVHLFVGGLFITFAALRFPARSGLLLSAAAGLLCDANSPTPPGTHLLLFSIAHALICNFRHRLPAEHTATQVIIATVANAGLYLALTIILATRQPIIVQLWPRLIFDLLLSELFLILIGPWFFALQGRIISLDRFALRGRL